MFDSYMLNEKGIKELDKFKENFAIAVINAMELIPEGRYKSIFFTKIEEAVTFAEKAIVCNPENIVGLKVYGLEKVLDK